MNVLVSSTKLTYVIKLSRYSTIISVAQTSNYLRGCHAPVGVSRLLTWRKLRAGCQIRKTEETEMKPTAVPRTNPGMEKISVNDSESLDEVGIVVTFPELDTHVLLSGAPQSPGFPGKKALVFCVCI